MAELVFTLSDVSLTSYWTVNLYETGTGTTRVVTNKSGASANRTVSISGIPDGEHVMKAVLTATITNTGTIDSGATRTVNGLAFSGTRKIDATEFSNGTTWTASFYFCSSGSAGAGSLDEYTDYSMTTRITDITLTLTTGTGSVFDGEVSSLNEGDKIIITEASSNAAYTLVHHEYNTGKALIFRDDSIGTGKWRSSTPSYASANNYVDSTLDKYFINTWYPTLPSTTTQFLQTIDYPMAEHNNTSDATTINRTVSTISGIESGLGGGSAYGSVWNYTDTLAYSGSSKYWTREPVGGMANYARCISAAGALSNSTVTTALAMRPTLGVLETQLVCYSESDGGYLLCTKCTAPTTLYINGSAANVTNLNKKVSLTLSWSAGTAGYNAAISGYAVWYSTSANGTYELYGTTTGTSMTVLAPEKHSQVYYFKVQTLGPEGADYCDSDLSSTYRSAATKTSNVSYYDGSKWILATVRYYNGSAWVDVNDVQYYNGSAWV